MPGTDNWHHKTTSNDFKRRSNQPWLLQDQTYSASMLCIMVVICLVCTIIIALLIFWIYSNIKQKTSLFCLPLFYWSDGWLFLLFSALHPRSLWEKLIKVKAVSVSNFWKAKIGPFMKYESIQPEEETSYHHRVFIWVLWIYKHNTCTNATAI